jgi:tetrahydromethanopterin S-methyltransferase subunit B
MDTIQKRSNPKLQDVVRHTTFWGKYGEAIFGIIAGIVFVGLLWITSIMGIW